MSCFREFIVALAHQAALGCESMHQHADTHRNDSDRTLRVPVSEAAQLLGISAEAVRQRIKRGTLDTEKSVEGTVYVLLDTDLADLNRNDNVRSGDRTGEYGALISELRAHNATLREQLEAEREARLRADTIIAQLTQANAALVARLPELESPPEPREGPEKATEEPERAEHRGSTEGLEEGSERPWWKRMFGG
jgi:DNA-binding transcriptional MerR regulator